MKDSKIIHVVVRFLVRYNGVNGSDLMIPREPEFAREAGLLMLLPDTNVDRLATILNTEFVGKTLEYGEWVTSSRKYDSCVMADDQAFIIGAEHRPKMTPTTCKVEAVNIVSIKRVDMDTRLGILVAEE